MAGASVMIYSAENKLAFMTSAYEAGADYYVVKGKEGLKTLELLLDSVITRQKRQVRCAKTG